MRFGFHIKALLSLLVTFCAYPAWCKNGDHRNSFDPANVQLTADDIQKISTLDSTDYHGYFTIIMNTRMRGLPSDEVEIINQRTSSVVFTRTPRIVLYAGVTAEGQIVFENLDRSLKNSLVFYFIMSHELEHSLQRHRLNKLILRGRLQHHNADSDHKYVADTEKSAMLAEWFFLHHLPEAMAKLGARQAAMAALEIINGTDPILSQFPRRITSARLTSQQYLESEWSTGRHTEAEILKKMLDCESYLSRD